MYSLPPKVSFLEHVEKEARVKNTALDLTLYNIDCNELSKVVQ